MELKYENKIIKLPDCVIVGAAKSGTTALFKYLDTYDEVFCSKIKEPWFFNNMNEEIYYINPKSKEDLSSKIITGIGAYSSLFNNSKDSQICIEASTSYLYTSNKTISNIKKVYADAYRKLKIIIILRNPIERAWSHYKMHKRDHINNLSFNESLNKKNINNRIDKGYGMGFNYLRLGEYFNDVRNYLDNFDNVKIYLYQDFIKNPNSVINDLKHLLSIQSNKTPDFHKKYNVSGSPKNIVSRFISNFIYRPNYIKNIFKHIFPEKIRYNIKMYLGQKLFTNTKMTISDREKLNIYYRDDIDKLSGLLNRDLSSWYTN